MRQRQYQKAERMPRVARDGIRFFRRLIGLHRSNFGGGACRSIKQVLISLLVIVFAGLGWFAFSHRDLVLSDLGIAAGAGGGPSLAPGRGGPGQTPGGGGSGGGSSAASAGGGRSGAGGFGRGPSGLR